MRPRAAPDRRYNRRPDIGRSRCWVSAGRRDYFHNTVLIGCLTLVSRLLGVARDSVCAGYFGAGAVWDAFSFAFRVPNLFRNLLGEGALSAALIPVFTQYLELKERREAWRLAWVVITATAAALLACLLLGEGLLLAIPWLREVSERWRLTLALTAVLLPYMVFICLTAVAGGLLNCLKHFAAPAISPVLLNGIWIVAVVLVGPAVATDAASRAFVLGVGILVAGLFQLLLQVAVLLKRGMPLEPAFELRHPGLRQVAVTMAPVVAGMAAFQVNVLLDGVIAIAFSANERAQTFGLFGAQIHYPMLVGANSVLYYGNHLMQFPLGVFGVALATAVFPILSSRAALKDWGGFSEATSDGLGAVLFIGLPAGVGMIVLRQPAVELLFERGAFTAEMSQRTAIVLAAYSTGMWAYCAQHVLTRAFYSLQDSVTPAKLAGAMVALNLVLNLCLIWPLREAGLAAATAFSAAVQTFILYAILARRVPLTGQKRLLTTAVKTLLATAVMSAACLAALSAVPPRPASDDLTVKTMRVVIPLLAGTCAYVCAAVLLGVPEMNLLVNWLKRTLKPGQRR